MISLQTDTDIPKEIRFRLYVSQRGYANVSLIPGKHVQFEHLGIITTKFDSIIARAEAAGWYIHGLETPRRFLNTPWGFRIELHPEGTQIEESLGSWDNARFAEAVLTVSEPEAVEEGIDSDIGDVPCLTIRDQPGGRPHVHQATLTGSEFADGQTIHADLLERTIDT